MSQAHLEAVLQQQERFIEAVRSADAEAIIDLADEAVMGLSDRQN